MKYKIIKSLSILFLLFSFGYTYNILLIKLFPYPKNKNEIKSYYDNPIHSLSKRQFNFFGSKDHNCFYSPMNCVFWKDRISTGSLKIRSKKKLFNVFKFLDI
ncbi:Hypothetical protein SRAE_X000148100 [Strongyloides ratti]|uniref:Uncharacterized protein n=1 Tax=Strongyloides ratti TaxID=34506 RepID=A0A090MNV2_STRRB|nr:Hypothetical protein SRAE_X000148100 [Strongyloides ratti]CEF59736.1 Hypothetical protein SRAE_X000148100 [Strongyloides ratti]